MFFELVLQGQSWIRKLCVINRGLNLKTHLKNNSLKKEKERKKKTHRQTITLLLNKVFYYYLEETKMNV